MVVASLLNSGTSTSILVDQVRYLTLLLIVTLIVALLARALYPVAGHRRLRRRGLTVHSE